jgi:hypothetical protein
VIRAGAGPQIAGQRLHRATSRVAQVSAAARGQRWNIGCIERPIMMAHDVLPHALSRAVIAVDDGSRDATRETVARIAGRALPALLAGDGRGPR